MYKYGNSLFIFRRDLRLFDNTGLNAALTHSRQVMACFIFDPRQIEPHPYQSGSGLQFMLQALVDLREQLVRQGGRLYLFNGQPEKVISRIKNVYRLEAIFVNRDYTPFSQERDAGLQKQCSNLGLDFHSHGDLLLNEPEQVLKDDGGPYQVFTAFYNRARKIPVAWPKPLGKGTFVNRSPADPEQDWLDYYSRPHGNTVLGGRGEAMTIITQTLYNCVNYSLNRDFPAQISTSGLSPYLKFGCCSIREVFYATFECLGIEHPLLRQYYWRDFFTHIAWHYPHVFAHAFHRRFDAIPWQNDYEKFQAWINGRTGFPIVDAGMRELQRTGLMHNRVRMITASFLVKDLHISWCWGERYFARSLIDYDPCVNNGNWQWAASTGCDSQPYFRILNPWLQQSKFDPECIYIKRWLPELRTFSPNVIHQWRLKPCNCDYPIAMVDHATQSQRIKKIFQSIARGS